MNKFADRLKETMIAQEIRQGKLAKLLNTTQQTVNRWVNGIQEPKI